MLTKVKKTTYYWILCKEWFSGSGGKT